MLNAYGMRMTSRKFRSEKAAILEEVLLKLCNSRLSKVQIWLRSCWHKSPDKDDILLAVIKVRVWLLPCRHFFFKKPLYGCCHADIFL